MVKPFILTCSTNVPNQGILTEASPYWTAYSNSKRTTEYINLQSFFRLFRRKDLFLPFLLTCLFKKTKEKRFFFGFKYRFLPFQEAFYPYFSSISCLSFPKKVVMFYPKYAGFSYIARIFCPQTSFLLLQEAIMSGFSTRFRCFRLYFCSGTAFFFDWQKAHSNKILLTVFPKRYKSCSNPLSVRRKFFLFNFPFVNAELRQNRIKRNVPELWSVQTKIQVYSLTFWQNDFLIVLSRLLFHHSFDDTISIDNTQLSSLT